jgi:acetyl-CoA C-acetyltransferase
MREPDFDARDERTTMIATAEVVAEHYGITREAQDEYALQSQHRIATAQVEGRFNSEIAPITTTMKVVTDRESGATDDREITLSNDEGNRPQTTIENLQQLEPVCKGARHVKQGKFTPPATPLNSWTAPRRSCSWNGGKPSGGD